MAGEEALRKTEPDLETVADFWEKDPCGVRFGGSPEDRARFFAQIEKARYSREPWIRPFAEFEKARGLKILEIGVGAGTDFVQWVRAGARATGVDITEAGVRLVAERLALEGFQEGRDFTVLKANAESLPFGDGEFDMVYSWGVLHHTPGTPEAIREAGRVLKPGGALKMMIYHPASWAVLITWFRHALLKGRPFMGLRRAAFWHIESPGTKTYTAREARAMLESAGFSDIETGRSFSAMDLFMIEINPAHGRFKQAALSLLRALYPRWLVNLIGPGMGLNLLIKAVRKAP